MSMTKICNATNAIEAERLVAVLKDKEILAYYQDSTSGIAAHDTPGFGLFGVDIYVDDSDVESAKKIIEAIQE